MIKRGLIYFIIITIAAYMVRYLIYHGQLMQESGYYAKYKEAFNGKTAYDVLFLGSSRVAMHYDPRIFDSINQTNAFNLSLSGAHSKVAYVALKTYLHMHPKPEYILYEPDFHNLRYESKDIMEFNNYFPFLTNNVLRSGFSSIDGRMNWFYYIPYYSLPYTDFKNISSSIHGYLGIQEASSSSFYKGFQKETSRPCMNYIKSTPVYGFIHPANRAYMDSIIDACKQLNIKLIIVNSPVFAGGKLDLLNKEQVMKQLRNYCRKNNLLVMDYSSTPYCDRREYFLDHFHMNYNGAQLFSEKLAKDFHTIMLKKPL